MTTVIAVTNRKGGVGKTTTAVNVASALAELGKRVVVLDLDTQRHASIHLGVRHEPPLPSPIFLGLIKGVPLKEVAQATKYGFDLVPAGKDLKDAAKVMGQDILAEAYQVVRAACEEAEGAWDVVLLDCPPSVGDVAIAALIAADYVLVPMPMQGLPYEGLLELVELMGQVKEKANPGLKFAGVFSTLIDNNTRLSTVVRGRVEDLCESAMLSVRIRRDSPLAEAVECGCPVSFHKPDSHGAADYRALVGELVERGVV